MKSLGTNGAAVVAVCGVALVAGIVPVFAAIVHIQGTGAIF